MNSETFKQRFLPLTRKLHWTAFSIMRNKQDAEDIVQEAFLKLWNKRHELEHVTNDEAYCVTLVKNLCLDAKRTSHTDLDAGPPEAMPLMAATDVRARLKAANNCHCSGNASMNCLRCSETSSRGVTLRMQTLPI